MAWETRNQDRRYYYRVTRVDGRVKRIYHGTGPRAEAEAAKVAASKAAKAADRECLAAIRSELRPLDDADAELNAGVADLLDAALLCAGFHKHRGCWRRPWQQTEPAASLLSVDTAAAAHQRAKDEGRNAELAAEEADNPTK